MRNAALEVDDVMGGENPRAVDGGRTRERASLAVDCVLDAMVGVWCGRLVPAGNISWLVFKIS